MRPDLSEPLKSPVHSNAVPQWLPYVLGCVSVTTASGGLILGVGPFSEGLIKEGHLLPAQVGLVFTGAFQMMNWGTVVAVQLERCLGPRLCAALGVCVMFPGYVVLATLPIPADPYVVMVAYGLLGWGGNHIYISAFQFAWLYPDRIGIADGILAGLFNAAGLVFMVLDLPSVTVSGFFSVWSLTSVMILVLILVFWPDQAYQKGDSARVTFLTLRHVRNPFVISDYFRDVREILSLRYWLYALTFAWTACISEYICGNLGTYFDGVVGDTYLEWAFPLIANPTFVCGWMVGYAIDKTGFAWVSFFLILLCQVSLACLCLRQSAVAAWVSLPFLNVVQALQYTIEFVFVHKNYPPDVASMGLAVVFVVQGLVSFIASPGLDPNPWGTNLFPPLLVLGLPSLALYAWPLFECRHRRLKLERAKSRMAAMSPAAACAHSSCLAPL